MKADSPSETAAGVALSMVASALDPVTRPLFAAPDEPYFEWFIEEHSEGARKQLEGLKSEETAPLMAFLRESMAPGAALFTLLRKLFIEREVRAALQAGAEQLVVLGGGYDPLTLRLQRAYPQARFYELDHPTTQTIKRRALEKRQALAPGLSLLPVDFVSESVGEKLLGAPGFRAGVDSVFVCEGVLMYLDPATVDQTFELVRRLGGRQTRFVFTFADSHILATDAHAMRLAKMVKQNGEELRSSYDPAAMEAFLGERGFRLLTLGGPAALQAQFLRPHGIDRPVRNLEFAVSAAIDA